MIPNLCLALVVTIALALGVSALIIERSQNIRHRKLLQEFEARHDVVHME